MSDKQLLELAAKAAGWTAGFITKTDAPDVIIAVMVDTGSKIFGPWNPLEDNGDALRLALNLGLCIQPIPECDTVQVYQMHGFTGEPFNIHAAANGDIELRVIIVKAAAEIGRQLIN